MMELSDYGGSFEVYQEAVYQRLLSDFVHTRTFFLGKRVILIENPRTDGREFTFCHLTSANEYGSREESERVPELRRLEIVIWLKPIIEAISLNSTSYYAVEFIRKNNNSRAEMRFVLWLEDEGIKIVLREGNHVFFLLTAFIVTQGHKKRAETKKCLEYHQKGQRPLNM
jgi:hypothetical protein